MRLPGPPCGNQLLGARGEQEEEEGIEGRRSVLNFRMLFHGGVS